VSGGWSVVSRFWILDFGFWITRNSETIQNPKS